MKLLSAICFFDKSELSTMNLYVYEDGGRFYQKSEVLNGTEMLGGVGVLKAKNVSDAIEEWNRDVYMKFVPTHLNEYYGVELKDIKNLLVHFTLLENNKAQKYQVKNYLGKTSKFYVKVFYA